MQYELPEDLGTLTDDELEASLADAVRSFRAASNTDVVTPQTLPTLRTLKASIERLKSEQAERITAAEAAAAEIDALTADVFGEDVEATADASVEDEGDAATEDVEATADASAEEPPKVVEPTQVVTAAARRTSLNLAAVRQKQAGGNGLSKYLPDENPQGVQIVASVDVPGYRPGQAISMAEVNEGATRRAQGLKTAGGGTGMVASYQIPFPQDLIITDSSSEAQGFAALTKAADQHRLNGGDLVASGGWCAPSETVYDIADIACPDGLWDIPEVQLSRGGLRFFRTPTLDVAALTFVHTEAADIAGTEKPCFRIPCPAPTEVRCTAHGVCLEVGILTSRFFPEVTDWYVRNSMVAHEIRMKGAFYAAAAAGATAVTTTTSFAAFSAVYASVALQAADMIERHNLCESSSLELVFPYWARNLFLADIARQQGVKPGDLAPGIIESAFAGIGVRVQWVRGLAPDVPTNIGGATPATGWPADLEYLIYPAGSFVAGRGPQIDLGVIIDSVTVSTNDQKIFSEECVALIDRLGLARRVTLAICPNGSVGAVPTTAAACPIA